MTTKLPPPYRERGGLPLPEEFHLPADDRHVIPDSDAPDDREPLPDGLQQEDPFYDAVTVLKTHFLGRPGILVSGNTPVYYVEEDGRQRIFRPDCYVVFGIDPIAVRRRNGYFIERVGKPLDFVLEIASVSTFRNDLGPKRDLYARLGIEEYWRFDATTEYYPEPLAGERLEGQEYRPLPVARGADGVIRGRSPLLGLVLCWNQGKLRFYDPATGAYLRTLEEAAGGIIAERAARREAEDRADSEAARVRQLEEELQRLRAES